VPPAVEHVVLTLRGGGAPLSGTARAFFEPRFGRDLASVRVHTGPAAAESARQLGAESYTFGRQIVFAAGRYAPESNGGKRLLAHELTHVVQQGDGVIRGQWAQAPGLAAAQRAPSNVERMRTAPQTVQRQPAQGSAVERGWINLPRAVKAQTVDLVLNANILLVSRFPGQSVFGDAWVLVKEGLVGFLVRVKRAAVDVKIAAADTIVRMTSGLSLDYTKGVLLGVVKGFFLHGLLGPFILFWDLIKGLKHLTRFFKWVWDLLEDVPDHIVNAVESLQERAGEIATSVAAAIRQVQETLSNPDQAKEWLVALAGAAKGAARQVGGAVCRCPAQVHRQSRRRARDR
jgi:hypothetical protein